MQAIPGLSLDWIAFALAGTVNDADFVPIRGLLESCFIRTACCLPAAWQTSCVAVCESRLDDFRSDIAPAVYPCKGDGRKVFAGQLYLLRQTQTTFSCQCRLEQSSICRVWYIWGGREVSMQKGPAREQPC